MRQSTLLLASAVLAALPLLAACGGRDATSEPSSPQPAPSSSASASDPPAASCPADIAAAVGTACSDEGQECGCPNDGTTICSSITCSGGKWLGAVVASEPPAPSPVPDAGPDAPTVMQSGPDAGFVCPPTYEAALPLCGLSCTALGVSCAYPNQGDIEGDAAATAGMFCGDVG
jgi:hypothetical protein